MTNRLNVPFAAVGMSSDYHIFDEGLDSTKPVGLLMYVDGSGGYGHDNPNATYLLDADGSNGLVAVARKHNLVLVNPEAPPPDGNSDNHWYDSATAPTKARWSDALMTYVRSQYDIDPARVVVGGYSSGAQWQRWFLPQHAEAQGVRLAVMIAYGGAPAVSASYSEGYKQLITLVWNTGKLDEAYSSQSYGAIGGYNWYNSRGFKTEATWPDSLGHSRSDFSSVMDRAITAHLPAGSTTAPPPPTPEPEPTPDVQVTVEALETGVTISAPSLGGQAIYFRLSNPVTGRTTYLYDTDGSVTFRSLGTLGDEWHYALYAGPSITQEPLASGTFHTWTVTVPPLPGDRDGDRDVDLDDLRALSESRPDDTELRDIIENWTA